MVTTTLIPDFKIGNKFFVKIQFFRTTQSLKKLSEKYLGPYKIIFQPSTLLFILYLSESICFIYLVFYIFILKPTTFNSFSRRTQLASIPVIINGESKYEISWIVNSKINC